MSGAVKSDHFTVRNSDTTFADFISFVIFEKLKLYSSTRVWFQEASRHAEQRRSGAHAPSDAHGTARAVAAVRDP